MRFVIMVKREDGSILAMDAYDSYQDLCEWLDGSRLARFIEHRLSIHALDYKDYGVPTEYKMSLDDLKQLKVNKEARA